MTKTRDIRPTGGMLLASGTREMLIIYSIYDDYANCLTNYGSTYDFKVRGETIKTLGVIEKEDITNALMQLTAIHPKFAALLYQFGHIE